MSNTVDGPNSHLVVIRKSGKDWAFDPETLDVKKDDTVVFYNSTDKSVWVPLPDNAVVWLPMRPFSSVGLRIGARRTNLFSGGLGGPDHKIWEA